MNYRHLLYRVDDRVAFVVLNRPTQMNALNGELIEEFVNSISVADADPDVRVVVISGAGGKAFSSGYDMKDPTEISYLTAIQRRERMGQDLRFVFSVWDCTKPVIAMIDGYCLAGAFELAMFCDVRCCSDVSTFASLEARFSSAVTMIMPWLIGQRSRLLIYTGDTFGAAEAERLGLVDRIFTKDELSDGVTKIAKRMSRVALSFLQLNKKSLNQTFEIMGFRAALQYSSELGSMMLGDSSPEACQFNAIRCRDGLAAANRWRAEQFAPYE